MARVDLARRAQIGRDRRARTRSQLIEAARALYGRSPIEAVTVDDVVAEAAVAKGTFYVHFDGLAKLQAAVAEELAQEFDELLQPRRLATQDPIERIAAGCGAFVGETLRNPAWGALVARGAVSMPNIALVPRDRLIEDPTRRSGGRLGDVTPELAFEFASASSCRRCRPRRKDKSLPRRRQASSRGSCVRSAWIRKRRRPSRCASAHLTGDARRTAAVRRLTELSRRERKSWPSTSSNSRQWRSTLGRILAKGVAPLAGEYPTTAALIERGEDDWRAAAGHAPSIGLEAIELLSPVTTPCRVYCQGAIIAAT